jgi:acetyl/propionyl-CoA carboxylase alpha subunit
VDRPRLSADARIGILNRGEAALRFIRAVKDYNALRGTRLQTVALYVEEEKEALFVQQADRAVALSGFPSPGAGNPYLDRRLMLRILAAADCGAAWPGWGFLSEDAALVRDLELEGRIFLGPSSRAMSLLGDKAAAKELAERCGVPVLAWSRRCLDSLEQARKAAAALGYPCMLKAPASGGGRGIRTVRSADELPAQYRSAREEALRVTGDGRLFLEALVTRARHLEVQALADRRGNVLTFGLRDCSVQRRNQKILEETPPPGLEERLQAEIERSAATLLREAGYESAGTVEFLYDLSDSRFYFMEVNTRLQVEHPITEQAYEFDLVPDRHRHGERAPRPGSGQARRGSGGAAQRGGPPTRLRPQPGQNITTAPAGRPGHPGGQRGGTGQRHPGAVRLHDRQDHRLRSDPRAGPGPPG